VIAPPSAPGTSEALIENTAFDAYVKSSNPSQRWGKPEERVSTAVYLSSPASAQMAARRRCADTGILLHAGRQFLHTDSRTL